MATTIREVLTALQEGLEAGLTGLASTPELPPEQAPDFPMLVLYPGGLRSKGNTPEDHLDLWGVVVEIHVARKDLPVDLETVLTFPDDTLALIYAILKEEGLAHGEITGDPWGAMAWGDVQTVGFRFKVADIKLVRADTVIP